MKEEMKIHLHYFTFYHLFLTERKQLINGKNNPSLVPIDFTIDFIESFSTQNEKFRSDLLNSTDNKVREPQVEMLYGVFKHMAQVNNQNLERNIAYLNLKQNRNSNEKEWSNNKFDSSKFILTY